VSVGVASGLGLLLMGKLCIPWLLVLRAAFRMIVLWAGVHAPAWFLEIILQSLSWCVGGRGPVVTVTLYTRTNVQ